MVGSILGVEGFSYGRQLMTLSLSGEAWNDARLTASFARNAALLPPLAAVQVAGGSGGTPNPLEGEHGAFLYEFLRAAPVVGAGIELGEAIDSCTGLTR